MVKHFDTVVERETFMKGVAVGRSNRDIVRELGRCHKTVDQELRRNGGRSNYSASRAQAIRCENPSGEQLCTPTARAHCEGHGSFPG